jgi:ParB family chromosome partitioning protein
MELRHIAFDRLSVSPLNMRHGSDPDVSDILPTIRKRGILLPLLVRPNGSPDTFEIVAGSRRFQAAGIVREEAGEIEPLPCAIMDEGDDAAALEASLIENIARLDPDEMSQHETFVRLIGQGKTVAEIADTFGITTRMVERRLALGNLIPRIRDLYRKDEIEAETVRHLTLATEKQQKAWLKLFNSSDVRAPTGFQLKQWLFGGSAIPVSNALFPLEDYKGRIVADLFAEDSYFVDTAAFWTLQNQAVAAKREDYLSAGWSAVEILEAGERFYEWNHERVTKKAGGKVFIAVSQLGEVTIHEGFLSSAEARKARRSVEQNEGDKPAVTDRPETTKSLANYLDLHRHALVRLAILDAPIDVLLRLTVAQIIAGSDLWRVKPDEQSARTEAITASIKCSPADQSFADKRRAILTMLGLPDYHLCVVRHHGNADDSVAVFAQLLTLPDESVFALLAFVLAESLEAGSSLVEAMGVHLGVKAEGQWTPDQTFFDLIRDRIVANEMVADIAGKLVAEGNVAEKLKTQKIIIRDCLEGANGRKKAENWVPRYMEFPPRAYTDRGGVPAVSAWGRVEANFPAKPVAP